MNFKNTVLIYAIAMGLTGCSMTPEDKEFIKKENIRRGAVVFSMNVTTEESVLCIGTEQGAISCDWQGMHLLYDKTNQQLIDSVLSPK